MAYKQAEEILMTHPAYENQDRIGNRWFQGRYRPGMREWGYPIRLPSEQWTPLPKMRGGFDQQMRSNPFRRTLNGEKATQRSSRDDRSSQTRDNELSRDR